MAITLGEWRVARQSASAEWGFLSRQRTPDGRLWGVIGPDHLAWRTSDLVLSSDGGQTWTEQSLDVAPFSTTLTPYWSCWCCGTVGSTMVAFIADKVTYLGFTNPAGSRRAYLAKSTDNGATWTLTLLWSESPTVGWFGGGSGNLIEFPDGSVGLTLFSGTLSGDSGTSLAVLKSDDEFATWSIESVADSETAVTDPEIGAKTIGFFGLSEWSAAIAPDGIGVLHARRDVRSAYPTPAQSGYDPGLTEMVTEDGGVTWDWAGRATIADSSLAPPYFPVGGDVVYNETDDRFYAVTSDRRGYAYPSQKPYESIWVWSVARSEVAAAPTTFRWTLEATKARPRAVSYPFLGMTTLAHVGGGNYVISVAEKAVSGAGETDMWVIDLTLPGPAANEGAYDILGLADDDGAYDIIGTADGWVERTATGATWTTRA